MPGYRGSDQVTNVVPRLGAQLSSSQLCSHVAHGEYVPESLSLHNLLDFLDLLAQDVLHGGEVFQQRVIVHDRSQGLLRFRVCVQPFVVSSFGHSVEVLWQFTDFANFRSVNLAVFSANLETDGAS